MSTTENLLEGEREESKLLERENSKEEMGNVSKETKPEVVPGDVAEKKSQTVDDGLFSIIFGLSKKIIVVGTIYLVGYMGWSIAWLITPVLLSVARDQWRQRADIKRTIAKISATSNEKDVILARIDDLPAWVYFPDVERCEWVNKIVKQLWPNANAYARDFVKSNVEESIAKALSKYKMSGFQFDRIILGTIPPRIGGVKVYEKNISRNEIIMDLDLFYASDCDINFVVSGLRGGIKDFQIHGTLRVILKPLIHSIPLFGGIQIFFLNNPNVDFNLVGVIDLLDMPGLSDLLRKIIIEQVASIMVLPNKLTIMMSEKVAAETLKMPEPEGVLRIQVIEARNLMKKDITMLGKGKSDPYAVINVGAQEFRTKVIDNNVNPRWDYFCEAAIMNALGQHMLVQLFDKDDTGDDEILGRATVEICNVVKKGVVDTWIALEQVKHGMVHVRLSWLTLSAKPNDLELALMEAQEQRATAMSSALLTVFVDSARNLPQARSQSKPDPYIVLSVGKQTWQTFVEMRNDSPVWEQGFTFLVSNPANDTLNLKVMDQKTGNEIGRFTYILSTLLRENDMEIVSQPFQLQKSGPDSKIRMSMSLRILKQGEPIPDDTTSIADSVDTMSRSSSVKSKNDESAALKKREADTSSISREGSISSKNSGVETKSIDDVAPILKDKVQQLESQPETVLSHRFPEVTTSAGDFGLGRIQLTLRYSIQRQKLTVIVHKIMNIPLKDPANIPDPYVKLYLLPSRSKESKRKTNTIKDNCNPVFDATFEYTITSSEVNNSGLEVTVCTQKGFLSGGSPVIGMLKLPLNKPEHNGFTSWYDLHPEVRND